MEISGNFATRQGREVVYAHLTDPAWLVEALDFPAPTSATADECVVKGDVGFGPLHGAIEIHIRLADRQPTQRATYDGWGEGPGSRLTLRATFELTDTAAGETRGTHVEWTGQADIQGPIGAVAATAFQPLSRRNFEHLKQRLDASD